MNCRFLAVVILILQLFWSEPTSAAQTKFYLMIGASEGSASEHYSQLSDLSFWARGVGLRPIAIFAAEASDLQSAFRDPETLVVIWIGHSFPEGGVQSASGKKIPRRVFSVGGSPLLFVIIACSPEKCVIKHYRLEKKMPRLRYVYKNGDSKGLVPISESLRKLFGIPILRAEILKARDRCSAQVSKLSSKAMRPVSD